MTDANFYLLKDHDRSARLNFLSRLVDKLYHKGLTQCLFIDDVADFKAIDEALWTDDPGSFLPHGKLSASHPLPITLVDQLPEKAIADVLIHLSKKMPALQDYKHFIHLILEGEADLAQARVHYKCYAKGGIAIRTHDITQKKLKNSEQKS